MVNEEDPVRRRSNTPKGNAVIRSGYQGRQVAQFSQSSNHGCSSALAQRAEKMFRRYSTHVAGLVEVGCWCWCVAFVLASIAFDKDAGDHKEENSSQGASESNEYDETNSQVATLIDVSKLIITGMWGVYHIPAAVKLICFSEKS